jgi:hypothetical protein
MMDGQLLHGAPYLACASAQGSVHLLSTDTGDCVDIWKYHKDTLFTYVEMKLCVSERYGPLILLVGDIDIESVGLSNTYV